MYLHQHWILTNIPDDIADNCRRMKEMNPEYDYILWDDERAIREFPELKKFFEERITPTFISDILRMLVHTKYKGIYVDADFIPLKPLHCIPELSMEGSAIPEFPPGVCSHQTGFFMLADDFDVSDLIRNFYPNRPMMKEWSDLIASSSFKVNTISVDIVGPNGSVLQDMEMRSFIGKNNQIIRNVEERR